MNLSERLKVVFAVFIAVQFLTLVLHDLVDIPGWTDGSQVQAVIGRKKALWATAINSVFPGVALALAIYALFGPVPRFARQYWVIYCVVTVISAIAMWYVPYLLGTSESTKREYESMYAGTRQVLPARGDNPRPNLLHLCFHVLYVVNLGLAVAIGVRG